MWKFWIVFLKIFFLFMFKLCCFWGVLIYCYIYLILVCVLMDIFRIRKVNKSVEYLLFCMFVCILLLWNNLNSLLMLINFILLFCSNFKVLVIFLSFCVYSFGFLLYWLIFFVEIDLIRYISESLFWNVLVRLFVICILYGWIWMLY